MKNLFSFATKELSQDAFLCWLFENFDDPVVGKATKQLIKHLASLYPKQPIDVDKITKVETFTQYKHIDIIAYVYINNEIYSFVIEDKTGSNEHDNQLLNYNEHIKQFKGIKYNYRIFYKTEIVEEFERKNVKTALWGLFKINDIYEVFKDFDKCENDILRDYALHIINKYNEINFISTLPTNKWNTNNWRTYFKIELEPEIIKVFNNEINLKIWEYHKKYISIGIYFPYYIFDNFKPLIEVFFRDGDYIKANIHIETKNPKNKDSWDVNNADKVKLLEPINTKINNNELPSFKSKHTKHCIGSLKNDLKKSDKNYITQSIISLIEEFYNFFKSIK